MVSSRLQHRPFQPCHANLINCGLFEVIGVAMSFCEADQLYFVSEPATSADPAASAWFILARADARRTTARMTA